MVKVQFSKTRVRVERKGTLGPQNSCPLAGALCFRPFSAKRPPYRHRPVTVKLKPAAKKDGGDRFQNGLWRCACIPTREGTTSHGTVSCAACSRCVPESLVFGTGRGLYGNHIFSVYAVRPQYPRSENWPETGPNRRYTEKGSFPYTVCERGFLYAAGPAPCSQVILR